MGCSADCNSGNHAACVLTWCDCGCHHDLYDAHFDGEHVEPHDRCHECIAAREGTPGAISGKRAAEERSR